MNRIKIDPDRVIGDVNPHIFGGFAELLGHVVHGGIYDPDSPLADVDGLRSDVREALKRLNYSIVRFPGGNFVSGYRWIDGIGLSQERRSFHDLAWNAIETNQFGTNEFIRFCRKLNIEPYLCVNCGDGNMREAADWVEYCNGKGGSALVELRKKHGFYQPHNVKYWGIGNEVDGPWQIGYKTPEEYARALTEFSKVMKWTDPDIKLVASANCIWEPRKNDWAKRGQLILEHAGDFIDYMSLHWYVGNEADDFAGFMAVSELFEERLKAYEGLIKAVCLDRGINRRIHIAVDEWGIRPHKFYSLEDALVMAMNINAFIRHANSVKMANLTMLVTPLQIGPGNVILQTIFYPFELYRHTCGNKSLDVYWDSETFSSSIEGNNLDNICLLDVSATLNLSSKQLAIFVVNRSPVEHMETSISLTEGYFTGIAQTSIINGSNIKSENNPDNPEVVRTKYASIKASGKSFTYSFEPHSITALVCDIE